jgi:hypothetical protein
VKLARPEEKRLFVPDFLTKNKLKTPHLPQLCVLEQVHDFLPESKMGRKS